jgi:hypothetical protein
MMIDRCSNKVAITSQDRLQPMDNWEDYPIKVLDIAPLNMVTLPTVSSFFSTCGCFLRDGRSSSRDLPPLSLACGWPLSANGSPSANGGASWTLGLKILRVQGKGGRTEPTQVHPCSVWSPLRSRGSSGDYALCPFHLHDFDDVIIASKLEVLRAWSPVFYASILEGCSFVTLRSLPPLEVISSSSWTRTRLVNAPSNLLWIRPLYPCFSA